MPRRLALPLVALLALSAAGCMAARAKPGEEPVLYGLEIQGTHALDADDIAEKLATQPSDRWAWQEARRLDADALAVDRKRVEAYYRERGFYDAKVVDVQVRPDGPGRAKVVMRVEEGEPILVRSVEVSGLDAAPEAKARVGALPIRPGERFTERDYDGARGALLHALRNTGWADGAVTQRAQILPAEHAAEVRYEVTPGTRYRFGPVFVAGTAAVPRDRVREQAGIEIHPGDWFEEDRLAKAQARVFDLGVFGAVRVTRGAPDPQRAVVPIVVAVREVPFRTLRAGPGVGVQANTRWDVNGTVGWSHRNFMGDLRKLQLELRAGYAWLVARPRKEGPIALATAEFSQPGAISRRIDATARLEIERGLEQAYDFWSERLRVGFPFRLARRLTLVPSWNLEVYQLQNAVSTFDPTQPAKQGPELQNCQGSVCLLSYLEQRVGWDGRNDPLNPRRGVWVMVAVQEGFNVGGYGYRYLRFLPEARGFVPLGQKLVLAARARVGALVPVNQAGEPPIVARFTAGGPQSMRGYYTGRLAPMVLRDGDWVPVGGNGLADGSLELRLDLTRSWGAALFVDGGNVSRPSGVPTAYRDVLDPTQVQWAGGLGLRYRTPFGPVRFDVGVQLPTNLAAGVPFHQRFPTVPSVENAGAPIYDKAGNLVGTVPATHREPWIAFHLSIGEAF
ncbi:surface antigen (D15) [Anaeromyxobacter sp. K]|uniref:BamA/OMP85 family outer membrane protein n=1 Tax=Anaeromyxobacter sp. (strain K) TaxID=447217 RepID=UPI00015F9AEB|nr:BamA/TamA family outer membrane protein [Anaeromyxobacter sp. K]ACG71415.1 surface antigen (D15) [Anaeromyxobacter sp. K]